MNVWCLASLVQKELDHRYKPYLLFDYFYRCRCRFFTFRGANPDSLVCGDCSFLCDLTAVVAFHLST